MIVNALNDGRYAFSEPTCGVTFHVDRLRRERQELVGELSVEWGALSARAVDGVLSSGTFNFSHPRHREERARLLQQKSGSRRAIDWSTLLEHVCQHVLEAERTGRPAIALRDLARPDPDEEWDVDGFRFPKRHGTILFGDGGTAKSYLCLYVAGVLARQDVRVAFFDWELDAAAHRLRLERLFGSDMPNVHYVRCDRALTYEADYLRRLVANEGFEFGVFDSVGYACHGKPEDAESATAYFRAARQLGIGGLHTAHVTKAEGADQRPFGSAFWHNSARSTWFVKLAATSEDTRRITIGLYHRKANLSGLRPVIAFGIGFDAERTTVERVNPATVAEIEDSLPLWQRVKHELGGGVPQTLAALADSLGVKADSVEKAVKRRSSLFTRVKSQDGIQRIALVERRAS